MGTKSQVTEDHVTANACAANPVTACGSAPPAPLSGPKESAVVCSACGHEAQDFHRVKHDGLARHLCSPCVLFLYRGMYCCVCFVVYETPAAKGPSSLWVSCTKCQRVGHEKCARDRELLVDSLYFTCSKCSQSDRNSAQTNLGTSEGNGTLPLKRLRSQVDDQSVCAASPDQWQEMHRPLEEVLAAAQIIALLAVQHAKDAKARARLSAANAARAAARAKAALDTAFRVAQDETRWKLDPSRRLSGAFPGNNGGLSPPAAVNATKNTRTDGRVTMQGPPSYANALSKKEQTGKSPSTAPYNSVNTRVGAQYSRMKGLPLEAEVSDAPCQNGVLEKSQKVHGHETMTGLENKGPSMGTEVVNISASPASILDAAASLDTPRPSAIVEPGPGEFSVPAAISEERLSSAIASKDNFLENGSAQCQNSKDQLSSVDQREDRFDVSAQSNGEEVAFSCMTGVEGVDISKQCPGNEKAGDVPNDVALHPGQK